MKITEEELKNISKEIFLSLCQEVKGHVFTRANYATDSIYICIKKGSLTFECGVFEVSHYTKRFGSMLNSKEMIKAITQRIIAYYRNQIADKYLKHQPTLIFQQGSPNVKIETVKEELSNERVSERSSSDI